MLHDELVPQEQAHLQLGISLRQLQRLRKAGLVSATFQGRRVFYQQAQIERLAIHLAGRSAVRPNG